MSLILASGSPRRSEILDALGIDHQVHPAAVDEVSLAGERPEDHAERLARAKAAAVSGLHPGRWVLAGDTVVVVDGDLLGKPRDRDEAVGMLLTLQGRMHRVVSALALVRPAGLENGDGGDGRLFSGTEITEVRFRPFERGFAEAYVDTGEPLDKAGAYGIQGKGAVLVEGIRGDYSGVVGLPVSLLVRLMEDAGRPYRFEV